MWLDLVIFCSIFSLFFFFWLLLIFIVLRGKLSSRPAPSLKYYTLGGYQEFMISSSALPCFPFKKPPDKLY